MIVKTNTQVVKYPIQLNSQLVFQDTNGNILTELNKVLEKNYPSCNRIPVLENSPPLLLMKRGWIHLLQPTILQ